MPYTATDRAYYLALKADPERWAKRLEYNRKAWQVTRTNAAVMTERRAYTRAHRQKFKSVPAVWLRQILSQTRRRAQRTVICFSLTAADVTLPTHCPITKAPLAYGCCTGDRTGPSLDRIIPEFGYTPDNVRVISLLANVMRQNCLDPAIFQALADDAAKIAGRS